MIRIALMTFALLLLAAPAWAVTATLTWSDDGANPTRVERALVPAGPWTNQTPTLLAAGVKTFADTNAAGTLFCFRVIKVGPNGDSTPLVGCPTNPATGLLIIYTP